MSVAEVIKLFNSRMPDLVVREIYKVNNMVCLVIAVKRGTTDITSPNSYAVSKKGDIRPVNPLEDLDSYVKLTDSKNRIYLK